MPLHPEAVSLLALMAKVNPTPVEVVPVAVSRRARRARNEGRPVEAVAEVFDVDAGGVAVRIYRPEGWVPPGPTLVWLHGGGWVFGDLDSHDNVCRALANRSGFAVASIDYALAPERPFPAGLTDALTASRWLATSGVVLGIDPTRMAIGGDSAGGNIAAVVAQTGVVAWRAQVLVYPVCDCRFGHPSFTANGEGYFLTANAMRWFLGLYGGDPTDPRVSPLLAPDHALAQCPPTIVVTAGYDPLRDEGAAYAAALARVGVPTTHRDYDDMIHGFVSLADYLARGREAWDDLGAWLRPFGA
jgi:acetyl esterase